MQTLQESLESKLETADGRTAFATWLGHFEALADRHAHMRYGECRTRLNRFLGCVPQANYKPWIPIGAIRQNLNALYIKCSGRKVAIARFPNDNKDFTISFTSFAQGRNPANESAIIESPRHPYRETLDRLRTLPTTKDFCEGIDHYPEWKLEAWLVGQLDATMNNKRGTVFNQKAPLKYAGMYLQVSSPFSASMAEGNGVRITPLANGHSDVLIRRGQGRASRLGILELKARAERNNISKSLCQAFAYTYCYHHAFRNLAEKSPQRANVLSVLGYDNPWWNQNGPPLEAIAVVPEGFSKMVIDEANSRNLFNSQAVKDGHIKLFVWEYESNGSGDYQFAEIEEIKC